MSSQRLEMPTCSCCHKKISPIDVGSVKLRCPKCGDVVIVRCSRCRQLENGYTCPACSFEGP